MLAGSAVRSLGGARTPVSEAPSERPSVNAGAEGELPDGRVVTTDDGRIFFLRNGGDQRVPQPPASDEDDLGPLGLTIAGPAPQFVTVALTYSTVSASPDGAR